ncbi:hypothetical protein P344_06880 [Spiroplasma mirum ATCC 29335]|uniref:Lipoprotein n=1 Tax=Spiroplasma mirum ATCC 29335 TaxID=838561 RepID=W6AY46_9MOLU|nr:lipoprotein [Spiroplasma mirum]AHI58674.1 hypothetical protein P344_06880 [Spiroplasma mirum ATCC 29335]AKM53561.1 hypothetical protein SATRI_v1c12260 [Spiroplasma atrichopogonis]
MKKILSILSSAALISSGTAPLISCENTNNHSDKDGHSSNKDNVYDSIEKL